MADFMTRRAATSGLATLGAAALLPIGARADSTVPGTAAPGTAAPGTAALETAARGEGSVTWYTAQEDAETAEALGHAFTKEHPGIGVSVIRTT
jgi:ABC-type glycerol-3-phosphate transport system substrate-binding protein